ncbi:sushi domain-containing protein 4-like [Pollicipes pollicipes]|uniref:sushi domain-containing protein 4-like n=1 Tax=Pollicipes pollicipes TaxID=41117 RepID=UPI001884B1DF|nr:sushi domain-containing protein 4-like [Pollicipes pollicipes]
MMLKLLLLCFLCKPAPYYAESVSNRNNDVHCAEPAVPNGRLQLEHAVYRPGDRARLICRDGFQLNGPDRVTCSADGGWRSAAHPNENRLPACRELSCPEPSDLDSGRLEVDGIRTDDGERFKHGAIAIYRCDEGFHLPEGAASQRVCTSGAWRGDEPVCGTCHDVHCRAVYRCNPAHVLVGTDTYQCMTSGEWSPPYACSEGTRDRVSPCRPQRLTCWRGRWLGVRRAWKPLRRPPPPPPPGPGRPEDADRVALIAYPEGSQYVLPTYEEAVRAERAAAPAFAEPAAGAQPHRPHHHRSLPPAARRERLWRREQESDSVSQRSVQSHHSASTRQSNTTSNATPSLLDSMGSTDTMATSDAASTAPSAATSASVRGMCGSLASFDTSSVLNTEGVPLLEENETELENAEQQDSVSCGKASTGDAASNK